MGCWLRTVYSAVCGSALQKGVVIYEPIFVGTDDGDGQSEHDRH